MQKSIFIICIIGLISGCIGDDYLMDTQDPELRILNTPDSLEIGTDYTFEAMYLNNVGQKENVDMTWESTNPSIISINDSGFANALQLGSSMIIVEYDADTIILRDSVEVGVGEETVIVNEDRFGTVNTTSSYALTGDFILSEDGTGVKLDFASNYNASTALPGLYVYLSNNPNSVANAYEIGAVQVFSGAHSYSIPNTNLSDYNYVVYFCKPFSVKVGHGDIQ